MSIEANLVNFDRDNPDHYAIMYKTRMHPEVNKFLNGPRPSNFLEHVQYLYKKSFTKNFLIIEMLKRGHLNQIENPTLCGYVQIDVFSKEVGWAIHPDFQGLGLGKQAVRKTVEWADEVNKEFKNLSTDAHFDKLILEVKRDNTKAIRIYEQCGFEVYNDCDGLLFMKRNLK